MGLQFVLDSRHDAYVIMKEFDTGVWNLPNKLVQSFLVIYSVISVFDEVLNDKAAAASENQKLQNEIRSKRYY